MRIKDIFEIAMINFKRRFKSNIALIVIFSIIIVVFNITYTLTTTIAQKTSANITENQNLRIISVSTTEEEIKTEEKKYIEELANVEMLLYDYCLSIAIEGDNNSELNTIGMDDKQVSYIIGENITLGDNDIILNTFFENLGYKVGDTIKVSYNARISNGVGLRETKEFVIKAFYEQPVIETWYDNVAIISQENIFKIGASLYGLTVDEIKGGNIYKQSLLVFVDDIDNVASVAKTIDNKGLITVYALAYSQELPTFAKAIIGIGAAIIIIFLIMGIIVMNATINNNIRTRYKEIGILKSIGMRESYIFSILSAELFLLWDIIAIVSITASIVGMKLLPNFVGFLDASGFNMTFFQGLIGIIVSYLIMFITTAFTIKKAANLRIIEVLRNE